MHLGSGWSLAAVREGRPLDVDACRLAVSMYCYEITKRIGPYAAALRGLETPVSSGAIGERAPILRVKICGSLEFLGVDLHERRNEEDAGIISTHRASRRARVSNR